MNPKLDTKEDKAILFVPWVPVVVSSHQGAESVEKLTSLEPIQVEKKTLPLPCLSPLPPIVAPWEAQLPEVSVSHGRPIRGGRAEAVREGILDCHV